jgi:hypothetical protein
MVMWNPAQDFFRSPKAEFRTFVLSAGVQQAGESRSARLLMICRQDGSEVGLTSAGDS